MAICVKRILLSLSQVLFLFLFLFLVVVGFWSVLKEEEGFRVEQGRRDSFRDRSDMDSVVTDAAQSFEF